jgi:hypothetical protein
MRLDISLFLATTVLLLVLSGVALAQQFEAYLDRGNAKVIVWKDQPAMEKGNFLMDKDIACIVPSGTKVLLDRIKASSGWSATVLEGDSKGCQGVVGGADFKTAGEPEAGERQTKLAGCKTRFAAWAATWRSLPNKSDIDRAIGQGCFDLLTAELRQAQQRDAQEKQQHAAKENPCAAQSQTRTDQPARTPPDRFALWECSSFNRYGPVPVGELRRQEFSDVYDSREACEAERDRLTRFHLSRGMSPGSEPGLAISGGGPLHGGYYVAYKCLPVGVKPR